MNNLFVVFAAIFLAVTLAIVIGVLVIKHKLGNVTRNYLGMGLSETAKMLSDGISDECRLPYSVPKLTPLYKPKIERDFPEMSYEQMESMVRNGIADILNTLENGEADGVSNSSLRLKEQLKGIIEDNRSKGEQVHYDDLKIHSVGVESYNKSVDTAMAVFQTALESRYYVTRSGQLTFGAKDKPTQNLFSVTLAHNQNLTEKDSGSYIETNCPNCGAPVPAVGKRECLYCGSGLVAAVDKIWQIDSFRLLK